VSQRVTTMGPVTEGPTTSEPDTDSDGSTGKDVGLRLDVFVFGEAHGVQLGVLPTLGDQLVV